MTLFGNKRRYLATTACKPYVALYVIQLVDRAYLLCFWHKCTQQNEL